MFLALLIHCHILGTRKAKCKIFESLLLRSADYTRTYTLGQTVFITWNQTVSAWPRVHLRLDPLSETNAPEYGVTYAILIDNATNTGSFEWTIGQNDNVTPDLIEKNLRMLF